MYIGPMDSTFTSGEESLSYRTDNPNPYKFSIDMVANTSFEDAVAAGTKVRSDATQSDFSDSDAYGDLDDGLQTRYTINYTTGSLTPISNSDYYTFAIDNGASPDLVGQAYEAPMLLEIYF